MYDQLRSQRDHHPAHDQRADHAPFQKPMLQALIHGECAKDHQEKKQIVHAESFFDQVAGKEFEGRLGAAKIKHSEAKDNRNRDPTETGERRFASFNFVRVTVEDAQVQRERNNDEEIERNPVKGRAHDGARRR